MLKRAESFAESDSSAPPQPTNSATSATTSFSIPKKRASDSKKKTTEKAVKAVQIPTPNNLNQNNFSSDQALLGFIVDYLRRRGLRSSVQCLYAEVPATEIIPLDRLDRFIEDVGALRGGQAYQAAGMLSEWWQVFWNILSGGMAVQGTSNSAPSIPNPNTSNPNSTGSMTLAQANSSSTSQGKTTPVAAAARPLKIPINKDISAVTKKPFTKPPPILAPKKNLDVDALSAIERSLTAVGLMSRDLTRLNSEEKNVLSSALRSNRVSIEAWTSYLQLCQEYTRNGRPPSTQSSATPTGSAVIIDQETRPVDSRQILWLRQNLYHQYMMRNAAFSAGLQVRSFPNSSEVSPLLINAPQLPLESPFYSPPRKLDDFAPLRSANFDVPLTGESVNDSKEHRMAVENIEGVNENLDQVEGCLNPDLPLDLFDVGFGNGDLMAAFANVSSSTGEQSIFELPGFDFYSNSNDNRHTDNINTNSNSTSSADNSTTDSFTTFTDNFLPDDPTVLIQQQKQHEEDLHTLMSEFLDVNNM